MKREKRYLVLKLKDIDASLTSEECGRLDALCEIVAQWRVDQAKRPLACVVVEDDWPEYEPVWKMIEARMDGKESAPSSPPKCEDCAELPDDGTCDKCGSSLLTTMNAFVPKNPPKCEDCADCGGMCPHSGCEIGGDICRSHGRLFNHCVLERNDFGPCGPSGRLFVKKGGE